MQLFITLSLAVLSLAPSLVAAHGVLTTIDGANGVQGLGFGVDVNTPRDGTRRNPFQRDSSIIRDREARSGKASSCGRTLQGGSVNIAAEMAKAESAGLPSADSSGNVRFTIHQVNADGAGPFFATLDTTGTGTNWQQVTLSQNVPGRRGNNRATQITDHQVVAQIPPGTQCTGGSSGNVCILRVRNQALAGPFGGCFAFVMDDAPGNATAKKMARRNTGTVERRAKEQKEDVDRSSAKFMKRDDSPDDDESESELEAEFESESEDGDDD